MARTRTLGLWLAAGAVVAAGVWTASRMADDTDPGQGPGRQPSRCLAGTSIEVAAHPSTVALGQSATVTWSVVLPRGCSGAHVRLNGEAVALSGSRTVFPPRRTAYTVRVTESQQSRTDGTYVSVTYPSKVTIDPSTSFPAQVLVGALVESTNEQQIVELGCVELDLTGYVVDVRESNRSLVASPECARSPRRLGPKIFVTDKRPSSALFTFRGDNILVSGFRLQGPTQGMGRGDDNLEKAILISPSGAATPIWNVEVSNMEIFHWSGVAVQVVDNIEQAERGRLFNTNPGAVRIRDNYLHHNEHGSGSGYGAAVTRGGYALIEQNVFDANRHAIAGGSKHPDGNDYSGYTARANFILPGGGVHCTENYDSWYWGLLGRRFNCWQTHQIDMHGDDHRWYGDANYQCGTAGETIIIERNTVLYESGLAIKIRGNPADKAVVDANVFTHGSRSDAIAQNGYCGWGDNITKPIDVRPNNAFGVDDPTATLGSCDFAGGGMQDQFMATGVTWWARSPVTEQWRYLNTMTERLPQLQFADFDGDGVCDVAPRAQIPGALPRRYSKSGRSPWIPLLLVNQ